MGASRGQLSLIFYKDELSAVSGPDEELIEDFFLVFKEPKTKRLNFLILKSIDELLKQYKI